VLKPSRCLYFITNTTFILDANLCYRSAFKGDKVSGCTTGDKIYIFNVNINVELLIRTYIFFKISKNVFKKRQIISSITSSTYIISLYSCARSKWHVSHTCLAVLNILTVSLTMCNVHLND